MKINQIELPGVKIVEFEQRYAASIAEMWNSSSEGWNGDLWNMTPQQVLAEETNCDCICLYLVADEQDKILGYCKVEEYRDKKAAYVSLLNVIPAFWNRQYGKALLLKALECTLHSGYKRLDLHSWSGNLRAVPLYKKTGFRWQEKNSSMYMMNFLPLLLSMEILEPFFSKLDWYKDGVNDLSQEPDSIMENGFELLRYRWERDDLFLEAIFNADGQGLNHLESNDFKVRLLADDITAFYGNRQVYCELENKTSEPLEVKIVLSGEAEIELNEQRHFLLRDTAREIITIKVRDDIERDGRTTPAVMADIFLNGKKIPLRLGLQPKAPVKVFLGIESRRVYQPGEIELFLQYASKLAEPVNVSMELADGEYLKFSEKKQMTRQLPRENKSHKITAFLQRGCFYDQKVQVTLRTADEIISYSQRIRQEIADLETIIYGETQQHWFMQYGNVKVKFKREPGHAPLSLESSECPFWLFMKNPRLSEPFTKEFTNEVPEEVTFSEESQGCTMKLRFRCNRQELLVSSIIKLRKDNILEHDWELENIGSEAINLEYIETCFDSQATQVIYDGNILEMTESEKDRSWNKLEAEKVLPGWMFYAHENLKAALSWASCQELKFGEWWQRIIYKVGNLSAGEKKYLRGEILYFNHFSSWQSFYVWKFGNREYPPLMHLKEMVIDEGNPFCGEEVAVKFHDLAGSCEERELRLSAGNLILHKDNYSRGVWQYTLPRRDKICLVLEDAAQSFTFEQQLFARCTGEMKVAQSELAGRQVYSLQGEKMEMRTSPDYGEGIFSLKYHGKELLSSSFPQAKIRGWSNHWYGGIRITPLRISNSLLEKQKPVFREEMRCDNYRNLWQGFSYTIRFDENIPSLENITVRNNYLVSPSQDVLVIFYEVIDTGGIYQDAVQYYLGMYLSEEQPLKVNTGEGILKLSERNARVSYLKSVTVEFENCDCILNFSVLHNSLNADIFNGMCEISYHEIISGIEPDKVKASRPFFLVLADKKYTREEMKMLSRLKWS